MDMTTSEWLPLCGVTKATHRWSSRKFCLASFAFFAAFVLFHLATWKCFTEVLLTGKYDGGDLSRMGYQFASKCYRKTYVDLPRRHLEMRDYSGQPVDVLTIGDSFSMGGGRGRNPYYQDYLASYNNVTVLNMGPYPTEDRVMGCSPLSTLAVLYHSGYLDAIKPRYVLIESLETLAPARFGRHLTWERNVDFSTVVRFYAEHPFDWPALPKVFFINKGNFSFYWHKLLYLFSDNAHGKQVYQRDLDRSLFSVANSRRLLFYDFDLHILPFMTPESISQVNDTMNRVADILANKGIRLIFMPVVSKYDLYSEFIVDNPYPKNAFFDELRTLPKRYIFIDTKAILLAAVRRGEKDIFFADDTHWSWKAADTVFSRFRLPGAAGGGGRGPRGADRDERSQRENRPYGQRTQ